jgi:hypothetical protein
MSAIKLSTPSSGSISLSPADTASNLTVTVPASTGTVMVSGNMPAFSAYLASQQNLTASTYTKVTINSETFDVGACFDTSTNRFTPNVAGYYLVNAVIAFNSTANNPTNAQSLIYKNGSSVKEAAGASPASRFTGVATGIVYMNGTTDYLEAYAYAAGGTGTMYVQVNGSAYTYFDACLIRSA